MRTSSSLRLYWITKQQLQSSRLQQCRAFIGLSTLWKKADSAANLFFCSTKEWKSKNFNFFLKILSKQHSAKSLTPFLQKMSCWILVVLKQKKLVKSHARCLRGLLNVLAFAQLLSDLNCQEPRDGGGRAVPAQQAAWPVQCTGFALKHSVVKLSKGWFGEVFFCFKDLAEHIRRNPDFASENFSDFHTTFETTVNLCSHFQACFEIMAKQWIMFEKKLKRIQYKTKVEYRLEQGILYFKVP